MVKSSESVMVMWMEPQRQEPRRGCREAGACCLGSPVRVGIVVAFFGLGGVRVGDLDGGEWRWGDMAWGRTELGLVRGESYGLVGL